jgi:hypothetical protein
MSRIFRDAIRDADVFVTITKRRKRGRPPIGRKAMTAAQRQARRRAKLREIARQRLLEAEEAAGIWAHRPPKGYQAAKQKLQALGHHFERTRREWGFESGIFVDGALVDSRTVIALADLPAEERHRILDEARRNWKADACYAVRCFMETMQVTLDELAGASAGCAINNDKRKVKR